MYDDFNNKIDMDIINVIKKSIQASFFSLLEIFVDEDSDILLNTNVPENIKLFKQNLSIHLSDIESIINKPLKERAELIDYYIDLKNTIMQICNNMYLHNIECKILYNTISHYLFEQSMLDVEFVPIRNADLIGMIQNYLDTFENHVEKSYKISEIISNTPIKMTKDKYNEYIKNGILLFFENQDTSKLMSLDLFAAEVYPRFNKDYGKYFGEIAAKFEKFQNYEYKKMSATELQDVSLELDEVCEELDKIESQVYSLFEMSNLLLITLTYTNNFDFILDNNLIYKDLYYSAKEHKDSEIFSEAASNLLNTNLEIIVDEQKQLLEVLNKSIASKNLQSFTEETNNLIDILSNINYLYYEMPKNWYEDKAEFSENISKEEYAEQIDQMLIELTKNLNTLPVQKQKLLKRFAIARVNSPFTKNDIYEYLNYVLENSHDFYSKSLICEKLALMFVADGFMTMADEETKPIHNHHHGDDCGCGHHH